MKKKAIFKEWMIRDMTEVNKLNNNQVKKCAKNAVAVKGKLVKVRVKNICRKGHLNTCNNGKKEEIEGEECE